jgi:hypothetical protein
LKKHNSLYLFLLAAVKFPLTEDNLNLLVSSGFRTSDLVLCSA